MSESGSSGSSGGVILEPPAKKRVSPAKAWCFTLNNYNDDDIKYLGSNVPLFEKAIVGKEIGEKGTPHLQGYLKFKTKCRPLSKLNGLGGRAHWESAKGTPMQNFEYCSKESNLVLSVGFPRPLRELACDKALLPWQTSLIPYAESEPNDREIVWVTGKEGGEGKTTFCKYLHRKYGAICLSGKSADMKHGIIAYKEKNGYTPEFIVVNIPRSFNHEYLSYTGLEEIKDMFFYSGKYEGGMVDGNCPHLWVFANEKPDYDMLSCDRWKCFEIVDSKLVGGA